MNTTIVRPTLPKDFDGIQDVCRRVYADAVPWSKEQLASHLNVFPGGQLVAVDTSLDDRVCGMAASLIVDWDDYDVEMSWHDFTEGGTFTNHDPEYGRTLYGAEVMVDPTMQGRGVGKMLYAARRDIVRDRKLLRIRAGARLRDYHEYAKEMTARQYLAAVARGEIGDRTLSFQIRQGFRPIELVTKYLRNDPESLGNACIIEWLNPEVATAEHLRAQDAAFRRVAGLPPTDPRHDEAV